MASTEFGTLDAQTRKVWSSKLARESLGQTCFRKFVGDGRNAIIQNHRDLESSAGDEIKYDLREQNRGSGVQGDSPLKNYEEKLQFYQDSVKINQLRQGHEFKAMSQQRTVHDLRSEAKEALKEWWSWTYDGLMFAYLAGTTGNGPEAVTDIITDSGGPATGFAGNPLRAPDASHEYDASAGTTGLADIDVLVELAKTVNPRIRPVNIDGGNYYVLVVHPYTAYMLRTETGDTKWNVIQQRAAVSGSKNPIFTGALGVYNQTIIYESEYVPIDTTSGSEKCYNVFMGAQAGVFAMGNAYKKSRRSAMGGGSYFSWSEQLDDYDNSEGVGSGSVFGIQKSRFNSADHGVIRYTTGDASHA